MGNRKKMGRKCVFPISKLSTQQSQAAAIAAQRVVPYQNIILSMLATSSVRQTYSEKPSVFCVCLMVKYCGI